MGAAAIILAVSIVIALFLRRVRPRNDRSKQEVVMENAL
jgi:hypothetical protein